MIEEDNAIDFQTTLRKARIEMDDSAYRRMYRVIDFVVPSPKQKSALNSAASALYLKTNNQFGKTFCAATMAVFQTTQEFPPWFTGWRQPKLDLIRPHSMIVWCLAPNTQMARDGIQGKIVGDYASGQIGQGLMPAENIVSVQVSRGIAGALDSIVVRRKGGSTAVIRFKSYEQGRDALQSESVDLIFADEMPFDMGLWNELLARLSATSGRIWLTATPRKQQSPVAAWFKEPGHPERNIITATIDDTTHFTELQRAEMKARYASNPAEAATRLYGMDFTGGGSVFSTPMERIAFTRDPSTFPVWAKWIIGFDPSHGGMSQSAHPAAAVLCCWDQHSRTLYVVDCLKMKNALPESLVAAILQWPNGDAPVAWGAAETQGTGGAAESYAQMYKRLGLNMLATHAQFEGGGVALEPGLDLMEQMFSTGKLQVARHLADWWEEFHGYERDERTNKPIPLRDDLMAATRYGVMMAPRYAKSLDADRVRQGISGRNRRVNRMARDVDFDVHDA